ncbi:hypothetical protein Acsp03_35340 [Actinomadura sp. NBRC 104412]|uniref:hypothetical protein n=1 Tax=Actinomadura sp. NBRC 104412 TaxID=3032203 RepID=UPI0024A0B0B8|nr:hypothetical protein [Actinomadura sp. NBRC 104412]GLZ06068.1 hypothetical protein Acsp03_35340 [Actinomadura sp. NBRC 104412]
MAPPPPYGQGPPPPYQGGDPYRQGGYPQRDGGRALAGVIHLVAGFVVAVFLLHMLFVVFEANQDNGFVNGIYNLAKVLVLGLGDVFTPDDAKLGVVLNYGLAALLYLIVAQLIVRVLNRP